MASVYSIYLELRYYIVRVFFRLLGLRVRSAFKQVEYIWSLPDSTRQKVLNDSLGKNPHIPRSLDTLKSINSLEAMSKQDLQNATQENKIKSQFHRHTAGTTGEPTDICLNKKELELMLGVRAYSLNHYGIRLGDREARLWGRREPGPRSSAKNFLLNRRIFDPTSQNAVNEMFAMKAWQPSYIYGYSSLVLEAANVFLKNNIKINKLKGIVCTAETILPSQKKFIGDVFECPVIEEYGSTEFDVVAFECKRGHRHLVNPWLVVEDVNNEIIITDLSRTSQALLRYQMGDSGQLDSSGCDLLGSDIFFDTINGRSINGIAFTKTGERFHSVEFARSIESYMQEYHDVFTFLVLQKEFGCFVLGVSPSPKYGSEHLVKYLTRCIKNAINSEVEITLDKTCMDSTSNVKNSYFVQLIVN